MNYTTMLNGTAREIRDEFVTEVSALASALSREAECVPEETTYQAAEIVRKEMADQLDRLLANNARDVLIELDELNDGRIQLVVYCTRDWWARDNDHISYVHVFNPGGEAWETVAAILRDREFGSWIEGNEADGYIDGSIFGDGNVLMENDLVGRYGLTNSWPVTFAALFGGTTEFWEGGLGDD